MAKKLKEYVSDVMEVHTGKSLSCKILKVLIVDGEESENEEEEETEHAHVQTMEVSLNLVSGLTPSQTMKIKGDMRKVQVLVLIDSYY